MRSVFIISAAAGHLLCATNARAECNPKDFLQQSTLQFSKNTYVAMAKWMTEEDFSLNDKSKTFNGSTVIKGAPTKASYSEMNSIVNLAKSSMSESVTQSEAIQYLKSDISVVGAGAYKDCLADTNNDIKFYLNDGATKDRVIIPRITWTPTYVTSGAAKARIDIIGGTTQRGSATYDDTLDLDIRAQQDVTIKIYRNRCEPLTISATIDGKSHDIRLPPVAYLEGDIRYASDRHGAYTDAGADNYLAQERKICVTAKDGEIPLPSLSRVEKIEYIGDASKTYITGDPSKRTHDFDNSFKVENNQICVWLLSDGVQRYTQDKAGVYATLTGAFLSVKPYECKG